MGGPAVATAAESAEPFVTGDLAIDGTVSKHTSDLHSIVVCC